MDEHIGRLYTAFLNTTSTLDWVRFLAEVEELPVAASSSRGGGEGHGVIFQRYDMPWPVKDREVVIRRSVRLDKRAKKMVATCEPPNSGAVVLFFPRPCLPAQTSDWRPAVGRKVQEASSRLGRCTREHWSWFVDPALWARGLAFDGREDLRGAVHSAPHFARSHAVLRCP